MPDISEKNFESTIECALLAGGPDACPGDEIATREPGPVYGELVPGGYRRRTSADYDEDLCLDPEMVVAFVQATQPKQWARLKKVYGDDTRDRFVRRLARDGEIPAFKVGRQWRVKRELLDRWIEREALRNMEESK